MNDSKYIIPKRWQRVIASLVDTFLKIIPIKKRNLPVKINKILLIKPDHYGDVLLFTSVFPIIKKRYPNVQLDIIVGSWALDILKNNPNLTNIYVLDHFFLNRLSIKRAAKLISFVKTYSNTLFKVRKQNYDVCILGRCSGLPNLAIFSRLSKSKFIIGNRVLGLGKLCDYQAPWKDGVSHEVENFLKLLKPLDIEKSNLISHLFPTIIDQEKVSALMTTYDLQEKKFIVIAPGAGNVNKMKAISLENWAGLIDKLGKKNFKIVLCGTHGEQKMHDDLIELCKKIYHVDNAILISLAGRLSISQLFFLFQKAAYIYTLDSLAVHLAAMTNVPTTAFYLQANESKEQFQQRLQQWRPLRNDITVITSINEMVECISDK